MPLDQPSGYFLTTPAQPTITMSNDAMVMVSVSANGTATIDWAVVEMTANKADHDWLWSVARALLKARVECQK